jgi:hypothetical protein
MFQHHSSTSEKAHQLESTYNTGSTVIFTAIPYSIEMRPYTECRKGWIRTFKTTCQVAHLVHIDIHAQTFHYLYNLFIYIYELSGKTGPCNTISGGGVMKGKVLNKISDMSSVCSQNTTPPINKVNNGIKMQKSA